LSKAYRFILGQQKKTTFRRLLQSTLVIAVVLLCAYYTDILNIERFAQGIPSTAVILGESIPPNFSDIKTWLKPLLDTIAMSIVGTALAFILAIPLGLLAASNTSPGKPIYYLARLFLNLTRAVPELIMGILFVAAVGFGALPGALALGFHSVGMVGKFISEAVEHSDVGPMEAITATGATKPQIIVHGILPQVWPQIIDVIIYRWEYNFRASTVMGMVGAGGIGLELMSSLRLMRYDEVSALLIVIFIMVSVVDGIGVLMRRRFT